MARNNKYASVNFNDIYDQSSPSSPTPTPTPTTASSAAASSKSTSSAHPRKPQFAAVARNNGRMLVLTRPSFKSHPQPSPPQPSQAAPLPNPNPAAIDSDPISLRPLGRTGSDSPLTPPESLSLKGFKESLPSLKPGRFVPPHLRPGFVAPKDNPGPTEVVDRQSGFRSRDSVHRPGQLGSPNQYSDGGRPKSGGYERMRRVAKADPVENRPCSSG